MKRLIWFLCLWASVAVNAQTNLPIWVHDVYRRINYPPEFWHTGFMQDRLRTNENANTMLRTMERDAINKLAESIIITVESETQVDNISNTGAANLNQKVKTFTSATLINLDVNSYYDPSTGMLYAFAAIKRSDLAAYFQQQLNADMGKAETAVKVLKQYIVSGSKSSARSKIKEINRLFDDIRFYTTMISMANPDDLDKQQNTSPAKIDELNRSFQQLLFGFDTNIIVYINCRMEQKGDKNDAFKKDPGILCGIITQALNENECIITKDITKADYELNLITSTTVRSDGNDAYGIISWYANVRGSLFDRHEKKQLVDFIVMNDKNVYAAGKSPEDAATKAFKLPALKNIIMDKILPIINN